MYVDEFVFFLYHLKSELMFYIKIVSHESFLYLISINLHCISIDECYNIDIT